VLALKLFSDSLSHKLVHRHVLFLEQCDAITRAVLQGLAVMVAAAGKQKTDGM
jgi:hypothetical protein